MRETSHRAAVQSGVVALCIATVSVASFFSRKTGACGTAHFVFFQLLGGVVVEAITSIWSTQYERAIEHGAAIVLNVVAFWALIRVWRRSGSQKWFVFGVVVMTALYLGSYFFFFPTRDCP